MLSHNDYVLVTGDVIFHVCHTCCRVGEEREQAIRQLEAERTDFEGHIHELCDQQDAILMERESRS